jgi:hypothetical protein
MLNGWLLWKESRQLLPLVIALVIVAATLFLGQLFLQQQPDWQPGLIFLIFPGLFATGAGAVLVGQEREQKTMDWLAALPITPRRLILTKFVIALIGLAAMWVLAAVCMEAIDATQQRSSHWRSSSIRSASGGVQYPMLVAHSVFILISGFYTSWRIKNQFFALILLAPLACLPTVLSELCVAIINPRGQATQTQSTWLLMSIVLIPVFAWLAYRTATRSLSPQAAPGLRGKQLAGRLSMPSRTRTRPAPSFGSQAAPIVWQSVHSTPLLLSVLFLLLLIGLVVPVLVSASAEAHQRIHDPALVLLMMLGPFLSVSWLAVSVFKGDGGAESVRFLADRGISPSLIFFARQGVPLALIAGGLIVYTFFASGFLARGWHQPGHSLLPSLSFLALVALVVYSVSQWTSQLVRTLTLAVILAPVITALVVGWFVIAAKDLGTPIWILGVCGAMPLIATWLMMRRYVDQRDRPWSWCVGSLLVVLLIALPIAGAALRITPSELSAETRAGLLKEARSLAGTSPNSVNLIVSPWVSDDGTRPDFTGSLEAFDIEMALSWIDKEAQTPEQSIASLVALRQDPQLAAHADYGIYELIDRLMLERVKFEDTSDEQQQARLAGYASWLTAGATVARGLRNSRQWIDQEFADRLEIVIISALTSSEAKPGRSNNAFQAAVDMLPSREQRNASRRAAVLASWAALVSWERSASEPSARRWQPAMGGISFQVHEYPLLSDYFELEERNKDAIVATAIDALRDPSSMSWQRRMHALIAPPGLRFELGPYSSRFRDLPALQVFRMETNYPARYWGMNWETELENLKARLPATPSNQHAETNQ